MTKKTARKSAAKQTTIASAATMDAIAALLASASAELGEAVFADDVQALLTSLSVPSATDRLTDAEADAKAEAQELAFEGMEAETDAEARKLAKRALSLDSDCVDALVLLADLDAPSPRERIERLQKAVAAGERSLGEPFLRENMGQFWAMLDTRPYMRAMASLADEFSTGGMKLDAIATYRRMLELNPVDNQGVRDPLLGLYLETGDLEGAKHLLQAYKNDASANFAWARVLERLLDGDMEGAREALDLARRSNRHVDSFLTAGEPLPKELPGMYSPGSREEAILCLHNLSRAWAAHKDAALWLLDASAVGGPPSSPAKRASKKARAKREPGTPR